MVAVVSDPLLISLTQPSEPRPEAPTVAASPNAQAALAATTAEAAEEGASIIANRTKLRPPSRKGELVARTRLLDRFSPPQRARLSVIHAPAGFGKTSLLAQVYERIRTERSAAAWLSLDVADNNYRRFLKYLILSIEPLDNAFDQSLLAAVDSGHTPPPGVASALLCTALSVMREDTYICIDDYHVISDPRIEQLMAALIQGLGQRVFWIIASRGAPTRLPLGRLRLLNDLTEVGVSDLQFSDTEAEALVRGSSELQLDAELVRRLNERAEGWVTGLQIALLTLRGSADPSQVIARFSGSYRNVAAFLEDEVLMRLEPALREFLLDTSVLARLNTELCNFLTQRNDARRVLDQLESLNLFFFSLDEERNWYRFHHLFAEFLNRKLREADTRRWCDLHIRAAQWLRENDQPFEALEHLIIAKQYVAATELLDSLNLASRGFYGVIERYAKRIPEEVLESFPNLQLERILEWEGEWDFQRSRAALLGVARTLERYRAAGPVPAPKRGDLAYLQAKLAHRELMVSFVSDDMDETARLCRKWTSSKYPPDRYMDTSASVAQMAALREHYELDQAAKVGANARLGYEKLQNPFGRVFHLSAHGLTVLMQGRADEARNLFEDAYQAAVRLHGPLTVLPTMPALLLAEVHYEQNRLEHARTLLSDYFELATSLGYVDKLISGYVVKARMEAMEGRAGYTAAQRTLQEGDRCARETGFERLRLHVLSERVRLLTLNGSKEEIFFHARREHLLGSASALRPRDGVNTRQEVLALTWARVAASQGNLDGAMRLLKEWYQFGLDRGCYRLAISLAAELARLCMQREDTVAACEYVRSVLRLGQGQFVRCVLDQGQALREVLEMLVARPDGLHADEERYAASLLATFGREDLLQRNASAERGMAASSPVVESSFSRRELDILEMAADDLSNREIATRLALSENTVKWYWSHIFEKLNVRRRNRAVNVARSMSLIF